MKKAKKLGLQSLALVLMAFVLVAGVAFGMTGAWFTHAPAAEVDTIKLGNGVYATLATEFAAPSTEGDHKIGSTGYYMPGDTVNFTGTITAHAKSMPFWVRIKVVATGLANDRISLTSVTAKLGNDGTNRTVALGDTWVYLTDMVSASEVYNLSATLTISGPNNTNTHINDTITVTTTIQLIQAANIAENNETAWSGITPEDVGAATVASSWVFPTA